LCKILLTHVLRDPLIRYGPHINSEAKGTCAHGESLIEFNGRDRVHAQRKAVDWWFTHRQALGLGLRAFFLRCRWSDERTIVFIRP
jgi:hypothetical protein